MQIIIKKNSVQQILLHCSRSTGSIKIFSWHKKASSNIKNALKYICEEKKKTFKKLLCNMPNFLEIQFFVDDLADFSECLSMLL